ncbi:MAG: pyruvate dehydrogenase (acetyl-transferring) E1 component subunit alpha [Alphaproteobacteria bacterium 16-39-46]|nr:MAG: pyruvate dehydrogenase (acetyl-transferring) E1 component subunit alpha [Alphaproteobacteria bacterium 16-39-46]OZA44422.1 MAG: pyruvate dehydrogenase (acetyl-transferring) E1 component subunit alpha [Alphaproteobacteria bacterium 17-39-52]
MICSPDKYLFIFLKWRSRVSPKNLKNSPHSPSLENLYKAYESMYLIRRFEEKAGQLYGMGLIAGFCHLYIGQEAVVVGLQQAVTESDSIITSYRDHGHMLACDMSPGGVMAELTGRSGGYSKGKGGSMHMFSREKKFYGGHGIVGAQVPIGTGLALAHQYKNDNGICFTYMGDGGSNQGQMFEAFNMAALWKLPVLYIIENNLYAMGTSLDRHAAVTDLSTRGSAQGIPGKSVDGMDYLAMREAALEAASYVRSGKGPFILEAKTYRYRGHSMSDPAKYRSKEEVEDVKSHHDPLSILEAEILRQGGDKDHLESITKDVKKKIDEAVEFAKESPEPSEGELFTDILV